jgi:hypothetical protein
LLRSSQLVAPDRIRFTLRAQAVNADGELCDLERVREFDTELIRDKIAHHHAIQTPELTFEELWQQLRNDLDARDA